MARIVAMMAAVVVTMRMRGVRGLRRVHGCIVLSCRGVAWRDSASWIGKGESHWIIRRIATIQRSKTARSSPNGHEDTGHHEKKDDDAEEFHALELPCSGKLLRPAQKNKLDPF